MWLIRNQVGNYPSLEFFLLHTTLLPTSGVLHSIPPKVIVWQEHSGLKNTHLLPSMTSSSINVKCVPSKVDEETHKRAHIQSIVLTFYSGREWQPTPVFLPGRSQGQRSLTGYSPWGRKEWDTSEHTHARTHIHTHTHTHLQIAFHMPGSRLRNKTFLTPVLHLREQTWRNRVTCSESQIQESSDQRLTHRQPGSGAHTLNCDLGLLPGAPPTSKPETFSGPDRTGQSSLGSVPTKQVTVYLHSSRSCHRCALGLAKEQMFNNFAVARHRLRNMAELFLNFGKCWLFFPKCHL